MRRRFGVLYLGAVHARAQLERRGHIKRRPRTDYLWALRVDASSNLYRIIDDVRCDRDRARTRRWNYRDAFVFASLWIKLRYEEKLMLKKFPDEYAAYQQRVKRIIPFIL